MSGVNPLFIVAGGAGFIGSNLVAELLRRRPGSRVVVIDNFRTGTFANLVAACDRLGVGPFEGEVIARSTARVNWERLVERFEPAAVFHLAAITDTTITDEAEMIRENVGGFGRLVRACAPIPEMGRAPVPVVYASSAAVYGSPPQGRDRVPFPESAAGRPSNVYGFSKWLMECEHRRFAEPWRSRGEAEPWIVGLRYFNVFGPGEAAKGKMASMVYQLARQMRAGERPRVFADGSQARDQVSVDDVVDCTLAAAGLAEGANPPRDIPRHDIRPGVYNLGSGVATSFNEIIAALRRALRIPERERPTEYFEMPAPVRAFYQDYTCADMSATRAGLGWSPKHRPADAIAAYGERLAGA